MDIVTWANEQAELIRAGCLSELDLENIAEEIEDVGKSEKYEIANRMAVLICHLLKWEHQLDYRGSSWISTIHDQRERIELRLKKSPSLRLFIADDDWRMRDAYLDGKQQASTETGISNADFPSECPWITEQIMDHTFFLGVPYDKTKP